MCTHNRWIVNKYTKERVYVPCGHCKSCQLDKSYRLYSRLRNEVDNSNMFRLFVTLNYSNAFLPFARASEINIKSKGLNVYRMSSVRYNKSGEAVFKPGMVLLETLPFTDTVLKDRRLSNVCVPLPQKWNYNVSDAFGVLYQQDFEHFLKRFKMYMLRDYKIKLTNDNFRYVKVQEYGPTTFRPHFHTELSFDESLLVHYPLIRRALIKAWPFCSLEQIEKNIDFAVAGEHYVSLYTVRPSDTPDFLTLRLISSKTSFSRGYGYNRPEFTPAGILSCLDQHSFQYRYETVREGHALTSFSSIPKYVVNRYFPYFKGRRLLDSGALFSVLFSPDSIYRYAGLLGLTIEECCVYSRRIERARQRLGVSVFEYPYLYMAFNRGLFSWFERNFLTSVVFPEEWTTFYDNAYDIYRSYNSDRLFGHAHFLPTNAFPQSFYDMKSPLVRRVCADGFVEHYDCRPEDIDPNKYPRNVNKDLQSSLKYDDFVKKAKTNDYAASVRVHYITNTPNYSNYAKHLKKTVLSCPVGSTRT